ncbi:hypothetical protein BD769DRAFT_24009 [Suillus cothurnatus]|jgi:hypothetical protein|nr:hypothetical protein BD769DRAFT_24009 [Suillus cothurnatus]
MTQYAFPSSHSPYSAQQPIVYSPSSHSHSHSHSQHGHGGYSYGTPLRRTTSGHTYTSSPQYGYPAPVQAPQTVQYLSVPSTHHRSSSHSRHSHSRPRANSHSHHGYGTTATYPVTYATSAPVYIQPASGHHRSHSTSHRHRSQSRPSHSYTSNGDYYRGRTPSVGDRVRQFFGVEPSSSSSYYNSYGNQGRGRQNSFSGMRDGGRSRKHSGYVDEHGREVDSRGRLIHRY